MKIKKLCFIVLIIANSCTNYNHHKNYEDLMKAYRNHQYFELHRLFGELEYDNKNPEMILFKATLDYVFNKPDSSNLLIDVALTKYKNFYNDTLIGELIEMKSKNNFRLQEYNSCMAYSTLLLNQYSHTLDSAKIESLEEDILVRKAITDVPKMTIQRDRTKDIVIPAKRDLAGLLNIAVQYQTDTVDFIFDTGANISVISESYARKFGINILPDKAKVNSLSGIKMDCSLGYGNITMNDISIQNALFLVLADSTLSFGNGYYVIHGIIGFPVINALEEIIFDHDQKLIISKDDSKCSESNFILCDLNPIILVKYKNNLLPFHFDTGADKTLLYKSFYTKYQQMIDSNYNQIESSVTGAGGSVTTQSYLIDSIELKVGKSEAILDSVELITKDLLLSHQYVYGNFGQDFMKEYPVMKMNFKSMCIEFYK